MLDIFSRKAIHWEVHATENAELAKAFIDAAVTSNGGIAPVSIHADRGTSMTSKPVAVLLSDLHISQSHSRPHVSNDNPFSEAQFKTFKYCPAFPGEFGCLPDARAFSEVFFTYYNNEHRHSGIGLHTPASVHDGTATQIQARRAAGPPAGLRRQPRPVPAVPQTTAAASQSLDQPAPRNHRDGGDTTEELSHQCLNGIDRFRAAIAASCWPPPW